MLKRAPSLLALPVVGIAAPSAAETETEVMRLFRQWLVLDAEERRAYEEGLSDEEQEAATDRKLAVELKMREAPKHNLTDVALALFATSDCGAFNIDVAVRLEFRAQALALMAA